ncbi:hypothetical protein H8E88_20255 [candidate division KSB1 bacterium]|nr:hypothetical protein [candidate division KSB1 bacterium]
MIDISVLFCERFKMAFIVLFSKVAVAVAQFIFHNISKVTAQAVAVVLKLHD